MRIVSVTIYVSRYQLDELMSMKQSCWSITGGTIILLWSFIKYKFAVQNCACVNYSYSKENIWQTLFFGFVSLTKKIVIFLNVGVNM